MINIHSITSGPRILALDVEMSFNISYHYDQWGINVPWSRIKHRQFMISAAWQWVGSDTIHAVSVLDDPKRFKKNHRDDYHVIWSLRNEINEADAVIAYNGARFDVKELNTGFVNHGLGPAHEYVIIDPFQIAKSKFRFKGGNSLANLCNFFKLPVQKGKVEEEDWIGATEGRVESIEKVVEYNKTDIPTMLAVWEKIRAYAPSKLNMNHFTETDGVTCAHCGSANVSLHKRRKSARATIKHQYQCRDCGGYTTSGKSIKTQEFR